jgi:hypothetical protein
MDSAHPEITAAAVVAVKPADLVVQLGPCRIEPVGRRLLWVHGGGDQAGGRRTGR